MHDKKRDCNYNEFYEKIKWRIEDENKNIKYRYIQGPPGEKGDKGEKGKTGSTGEKGDIGVSETIAVDETETIDSTEKANVIDKLENNIHHLTFYIPKGETEPMGPGAGSTSFNSIISFCYVDATDSRSLTIKEKNFYTGSY